MVVDKPHGLPSQAPRGGGDCVVDRLKVARTYVALHHRLDTPASGLLVLSVSPDANPSLAEAFREHQVRRTYAAVLYGRADSGVWDRPVDGKPARTRVDVQGAAHGLTAVHLYPETGRKHQLRIHASLSGAPICGDRRYGGDAGRRWPRLALHALRLELTHPVTGQPLRFEAPLPDDLRPLWEEAS